MINPIIEGMSLKTIENNIQSEIRNHEFWGDLEVSHSEMEILKNCIKAVISNGLSIEYICKNYPHSFTTYMVFFVRYKYNINFWGALSDDLGISISADMYSNIGFCAKQMFSKYGMDYSDVKDEVHRNIAPIIYEACLPPESNLDDLFYVMSYDANKVFDPQVIIEELLDRRSYLIRKPLYRFLSRFRDNRAIELILEVRDAMLSANQRGSKSSPYLGNYVEWREQEKTKAAVSNRKKQEFQIRPYLFFDLGNKGLCIILPRVIMDNEWIDDVAWKIKGKTFLDKTIYCNVLGDEGRRYTDSITVSVSPSDNYTIILETTVGIDEKYEKEWVIDGVSKDKILYFNSNGRLVNANQLLFPYGILVVPENTKIIETDSLDIADQYYPANNSNYRIVSVTPLSYAASMKYTLSENSYSLMAKPQINMVLEGQTLFGLDNNIGIYTKVPVLKILIDGCISSSGLNIRIGTVFYPIEIDNTKENVFDIGMIAASEISQFGTFSIRLYQGRVFLKQVEFCYVPQISTNYSPFIQWPKLNEKQNKKTYKFQIIDEWEITFEGCVVGSDGEFYTVSVPSNLGSVKASLKSMQEGFNFECEFNLPMHPFEAEILDEEGNVTENATDKFYKVEMNELLESERWLSIRTFGIFQEKAFSVQLRSANGVEQIESVNLAQNGAGNLNLSAFNDTLRNCPLPARLEIICDNDESQTMAIILVTEKLSMVSPVKYTLGEKKSYITLGVADDEKDISIRRFGFNSYEVHIPYSKSVLGKKGKRRGYPYPGALHEGVYIVSGSKEQAVFEFEEASSFELSVGNNLLIVSSLSQDNPEITNIKEWLELFVTQANNVKDADFSLSSAVEIMKSTRELDDLENVQFNDGDIEKLVVLAYFVNSKIARAKKEILRKCMRLISTKFLHRGDRYRIIELLMELNAPQQVFDICLQEYSLMLFYCDKMGIKELAAKVENYSIELSLLLLMSTDASVRECIWKEKYRDLIGRDAIRKLLSVPHTNDLTVIVDEQKKFMREMTGCRVHIYLDDEITGNIESIQGMLIYESKDILLDLSKKPDYGIYFGRIRFVDQYVNWYKKTHDKKGNRSDDIKKLMIDVVKKNNDSIMKAYSSLSKDPQLSIISKQYSLAVSARCGTQANLLSYLKYFQLQGLAAFLARLPMDRTDLDKLRAIGIRFMETAFIIAPKLSERDILMAETYRYLKRKEELLCQ